MKTDRYERIKRLTDEDREEVLAFALKRSKEIQDEWDKPCPYDLSITKQEPQNETD